MSWSVNAVVKAVTAGADIDAIVISHTVKASQDQLAAAKKAAITLIASSAMGKVDYYNVSLSGHANENHGEGSLESVYVAVSQIKTGPYTAYEVQAAVDEHPESGSFWNEIDWWVSRNKDGASYGELAYLTLRGEKVPVEAVEYDGGGEGHGESIHAVIKVGDQLFRKDGYYASHYGSDWDGQLYEVEPVEKTITVYNKK